MEQHAPLMKFPSYSSLDFSTKRKLRELWRIYQYAPNYSMARMLVWLNNQPALSGEIAPILMADLIHPLQVFIEETSAKLQTREKSSKEIINFSQLKLPNFIKFIDSASPNTFVSELRNICRISVDKTEVLRDGRLGTKPDSLNNSVIYPPARYISGRLNKIYVFVKKNYKMRPSFTSLVAYIAILNIHPFRDGNGHAARALYNWMMNGTRNERLYLPLHELSKISKGSYLIAIREAQYYSKFDNVTSFHERTAARLFL